MAAAECALLAAETYRMANKADGRKKALELAATLIGDPMKFVAENNLAHATLMAGDGDAAVQQYKDLMASRGDSYLAQWAALDLGRAYEQLGRTDEAIAVYDDVLARWPDTPGAEEVTDHKVQLGVAPTLPGGGLPGSAPSGGADDGAAQGGANEEG
jgi:tetratricopeptide (TPR) repeat protein